MEQEKKVSDIQELINKCKIDLSEELAPLPVAMEINSETQLIPLFSKGNFSIIGGPPKARKSYLISMFIVAAIKGFFQGLFFCSSQGMNLLFDTEQSKYKVQQIAKRISQLAEIDKPDNFEAYCLRPEDPLVRADIIERVIKTTPNMNFVVIDGIIDLDTDPIMIAEQAQKIIQKLMKWSEIYNIHICCVLHYNKDNGKGWHTLLGHLGSMAHRKGDCIIQVTKSKENPDISEVMPIDCREKEFSPFAFSVDPKGMPFILPEYSFEKKVKEKKADKDPKTKTKFTPQDFDSEQHIKILDHVFKTRKEHGYTELWESIKLAAAMTINKFIADNTAKLFITYYSNEGSIVMIKVPGKKYNVYTLPGQVDLALK